MKQIKTNLKSMAKRLQQWDEEAALEEARSAPLARELADFHPDIAKLFKPRPGERYFTALHCVRGEDPFGFMSRPLKDPAGVLITFEGNDGAGKTTAIEQVYERLKAKGADVILTREPGGSKIAEKIRELLLDVDNAMDPKTEALLYAASRREHLVSTILPALKKNQIVLCDRYLDSSLAYQGEGRSLGLQKIEALNDFGLEGFRPDLTLFFALDPQTEAKRMNQRGELNRLDQESLEFHQKVRDGFEKLRQQYPERIVTIDASKSKEEVLQEATDIILKFLDLTVDVPMDEPLAADDFFGGMKGLLED